MHNIAAHNRTPSHSYYASSLSLPCQRSQLSHSGLIRHCSYFQFCVTAHFDRRITQPQALQLHEFLFCTGPVDLSEFTKVGVVYLTNPNSSTWSTSLRLPLLILTDLSWLVVHSPLSLLPAFPTRYANLSCTGH